MPAWHGDKLQRHIKEDKPGIKESTPSSPVHTNFQSSKNSPTDVVARTVVLFHDKGLSPKAGSMVAVGFSLS